MIPFLITAGKQRSVVYSDHVMRATQKYLRHAQTTGGVRVEAHPASPADFAKVQEQYSCLGNGFTGDWTVDGAKVSLTRGAELVLCSADLKNLLLHCVKTIPTGGDLPAPAAGVLHFNGTPAFVLFEWLPSPDGYRLNVSLIGEEHARGMVCFVAVQKGGSDA